ncbi:tetratricopeptide repeat protein [Moorena sp. SIO3A2]|uniref:nSTAND1 domain-containing NTPase n=1 Tax=Moorena sp. SIO3A2 TaxID=2607841 RepID=UPI0013B7DFF1|nr:tetratricopeptide repeat protein [Moorena sp. SIO3A2]NER91125.1 ATP-binding protein [Moorena sp. SIO3A2]
MDKSNAIATENQHALKKLASAVEASQGQFKLILARCNYIRVRFRLVAQLPTLCSVDINTVTLKPSDNVLYDTIRSILAEERPSAVMVLGLESVQNLAQMLSVTNQVLEEFQKNLPFPLVLWITDDVQQQLIQFAPDFESLGTRIEFAMFLGNRYANATETLITELKETTDAIFDYILKSNSIAYFVPTDIGILRHREIDAALKDLQHRGETLEPALKASIEFLRGQEAYANYQLGSAVTHYEQSLAFWQPAQTETERSGDQEITRSGDGESRNNVSSSNLDNLEDVNSLEYLDNLDDINSLEYLDNLEDINNLENGSDTTVNEITVSDQQFLERQGIVLFYIGLCYFQQGEKSREPENCLYWNDARGLFQQCLDRFEQLNRHDLVTKFINQLGEVMQRLEDWDDLYHLAHNALGLQQRQILLGAQGLAPLKAQAYGFLAEVALNQSRWQEAKQNAQKALDTIATVSSGVAEQGTEETQETQETQGTKPSLNSGVSIQDNALQTMHSLQTSLYLLLLAQSEQRLGEAEAALQHLEQARVIAPEDNPRFYTRILQGLRSRSGRLGKSLYFQQGQYLQAFQLKQYQQSLAQQYGWGGFIGAGGLQPRQQIKLVGLPTNLIGAQRLAPLEDENPETIALEIAHSGRQQDVNRLIERIGSNDYRLIVIHGKSGVGKSSLVNGGLVPGLKQTVIGTEDVLPVVMAVYSNWVEELGRLLVEALTGINIETLHGTSLQSPDAIIQQLRQNEQHNLRTVLIFDQFEDFFFVYLDKAQRRQFFEFLEECVTSPSVKVILSMREDYLHYLLECERAPWSGSGNPMASMDIIGNDILSKHVRYPLGNFSGDDAKSVIEQVTKQSSFDLEPALIEELVQDLAGEFSEVRPMELQIVGAQLQAESITTLEHYWERGSKPGLMARYVTGVVEDCGPENQQVAELVLYLITDETGNRPLKTKAELANYLGTEADKLELVLRILLESGLVVKVPDTVADRYQLFHDYLVSYLRQPALNLDELITKLKQADQAKQGLANSNQKASHQIRIGSAVLSLTWVR